MEKNGKKIASVLGAATVAAGIGIAAVAQACPQPAPPPPASDPTTFFNDVILTTNTNGTLNESGLSNFWELYNNANDSSMHPNNNVSQTNAALLSNVTVTYTVTNVVYTSGNLYNLTFAITEVTGNVLGATDTTTFSPSQNNSSLYQLEIENLDVSLTNVPAVSISATSGIDADFLASRVAAGRIFKFFNTSNTHELLDTAILSPEFSIVGNIASAAEFRSNVVNFLFHSFHESNVTVSLPQDSSSSTASVVIATGGAQYQYPERSGNLIDFAVNVSGPLSFPLDISTDFVAPTTNVTGSFLFEIPADVRINNIWNPDNQNSTAGEAELINSIGIILVGSVSNNNNVAPVEGDFPSATPIEYNAALALWNATGWVANTIRIPEQDGVALGETPFSSVTLSNHATPAADRATATLTVNLGGVTPGMNDEFLPLNGLIYSTQITFHPFRAEGERYVFGSWTTP